MLLVAADAYGGDWRDALPAAAAVELVHNFSLVHDDIEDRSPYRRGRETLWYRWSEALAINAGDALFTLAYQSMTELASTCDPKILTRCLHVMNQTCLQLTGGQHLDISYEKETDIPIDCYWSMVAGKTAALLGACMELGAIIGGASPAETRALKIFGQNLGLGFQVQDDLLGIWGDTDLTGKSTESDLVSMKKTLPVLYGLQKSEPFAQAWSKGNISSTDVPELVMLLDQAGVQSLTEMRVVEFTRQAMDELAQANCREPVKTALQELASSLISRKK